MSGLWESFERTEPVRSLESIIHCHIEAQIRRTTHALSRAIWWLEDFLFSWGWITIKLGMAGEGYGSEIDHTLQFIIVYPIMAQYQLVDGETRAWGTR